MLRSVSRLPANRGGFYLFDEPTSQIDESATRDVLAMIRAISNTHGVLVVSHDQELPTGAHTLLKGR